MCISYSVRFLGNHADVQVDLLERADKFDLLRGQVDHRSHHSGRVGEQEQARILARNLFLRHQRDFQRWRYLRGKLCPQKERCAQRLQ